MYAWILQNAVVSGVLAMAAAALCRLGRFSPAVKHALWLVVLIKLITPPVGHYPVPQALDKSLRWLTSTRLPQGMVDSSTLDASPPTLDLAETAEAWSRFTVEYDPDLPLPGPGLIQDRPGAADQARSNINGSRLAWWLVATWLAGAVVVASIQVAAFVRLRGLLRQSVSAPEWLEGLVHQAAQRLCVRPPQVAVIPALCSPMVCSLGRPRLLWPASLSDHLGREAQEAVLLHELAHLRRRDHLVAWLEVVAGAIWWFNPVYWYARHQIHENAELACDAWVVALLPAGRRAYAHALVEVTEFVSSAPAILPAVAMGNVARTSLERRLTMIMRESFSYRVPLIGSGVIGLALLAVLPGWSRGQQIEGQVPHPRIGLPAPGAQPAVGPAVPAGGPAVGTIPSTAADVAAPGGAAVAGPQAQEGNSLPGSDIVPLGAAPHNNVPSAGLGTPAAVDGENSADRRIEEVEAKLAALLAEVQQLRGSGPANQQQSMKRMMMMGRAEKPGVVGARRGPEGETLVEMGQPGGPTLERFTPPADPANPFGANLQAYRADRRRFDALRGQRAGTAGRTTDDVETLTRARYKLPQPVADAARGFIEEYFKRDIGAKVEGDVLTIIASPEDQQRISVFVELLRDSGRAEVGGAQSGY